MRTLIKKLFCCHDWEEIHTTSYTCYDKILLKCKKCGKLVKKTV